MAGFPIENYIYGTFFGNSVLQYLIFLGCIAGAVLVGKIFYFISKTILRALTRKTKSSLDDIIVEVIEGPVIFVVVIIGFFVGYNQLNLASGAENLFNMFTKTLVTVAVAWFVVKFVDKLIEHYVNPLTSRTKTDLDDHLVPLMRKMAKYCIIAIAILIILSNFGVNVTSAVAGLGIGGLAFALAAQETLKNILGGVAILTDRPFRMGDWIEVDKYQGAVTEIGMRSTRLKTTTGEYVTIPNSLIASTSTLNFLKFPERKITFSLGLTYDTTPEKIDKAKAIIRSILEATERVNKQTIDIFFTRFDSYALNLDVVFEVNTNSGKEMNIIRDSFNMKLMKELAKAKISMAFPTQTIELKR